MNNRPDNSIINELGNVHTAELFALTAFTAWAENSTVTKWLSIAATLATGGMTLYKDGVDKTLNVFKDDYNKARSTVVGLSMFSGAAKGKKEKVADNEEKDLNSSVDTTPKMGRK